VRFPRRTPSTFGDAPDPLAYELQQEKAAALGRMGRRLHSAMEALRAFDASRDPAADPAERAALVDAAGEALWYYVIQREVCGFRDSEAMMRQLGIPAEVRLRMGYRPKT
jgi:hypothetical protein